MEEQCQKANILDDLSGSVKLKGGNKAVRQPGLGVEKIRSFIQRSWDGVGALKFKQKRQINNRKKATSL